MSRTVRDPARRQGSRRRRAATLALAAAAAWIGGRDTGAATVTWGTGNGNWGVAGNWVGGALPATNDVVQILDGFATNPTVTFSGLGAPAGALNQLTIDATNSGGIGAATLLFGPGALTVGTEYVGFNGRGALSMGSGTHTVTGILNVGFNPNSAGFVTMNGGLLSVGQQLFVGDDANANGTFSHNGGTVTVGSFLIGNFSTTSSGTYTLSGASAVLNLNTNGVVGSTGTGTFNQSNGVVNLTGGGSNGIQIGGSNAASTSARGVYNLSGGTLNGASSSLTVGYFGGGTMNQSGGVANLQTVYLGGGLTGAATSVRGVYNLSAGTLNASAEYVGNLGTGTFNQTNGANLVTSLSLGNNVGSVGTYNLSGGTLGTTNTIGIVGYSGLGTFNQTAGTSRFSEFNIGEAIDSFSGPFGTGVANLSGGSLTVASVEAIGLFGSGSFNQTGGVHAVGSLNLGYGTAGSGTFTLGGGTLNVNAESVGISATGVFQQSAGTHTVATSLIVGNGGLGTFGLAGGTLTVNGSETIGNTTIGSFTQSNGAHVINGPLTVSATNASAAGSYALLGGSLTAYSITVNPNGAFNQFGGTLLANSFILAGGTVNGTLQNQGNFTYQTGNFAGRLLNQGTVSLPQGTATFGNGIENDTAMTIGAGQTVVPNGLSLENLGTLTLAGGTLGGVVTQFNDVGAVLQGHGTINAPLQNLGTIAADGVLQTFGSLANGGTVNLPAGTSLRLNAPSNTNVGLINATGGAIVLPGTGAMTNTGVITLGNGGGVSGFNFSAGQLTNAPGGKIQGAGLVTGVTLVNNGLIFANGTAPLILPTLQTNPTGAELRVADNATLGLQTFFTFINTGLIRLQGPNASVTAQSIVGNGTIRGVGQVNGSVNNIGLIVADGGTLQLTATNNANAAAGHIQATTGNTVTYIQGLALNQGAIDLGGGTFDNNNQPLTNAGNILGNGTFRSGGLLNSGTVSLADVTSSVYGAVTNTGSIKITSNTTTFYGFVNNSTGTIKTTSAVARYLAGMSLGGTYISDPSTNHLTDLNVSATGVIQGGAGDQFILTGSYTSAATNAAAWNTQNVLLRLTGGGTHNVSVAPPGGAPFTWGQFVVDSGNIGLLSGAGGFFATSTTNSGSIQQVSGISSLGALGGSGTLTVGATAAAQVSLTQFNQSAVSIGNGGTVTMSTTPPASRVTDLTPSFTITGNGTLDLNNHAFQTTTTPALRTHVAQAAGPVLASNGLNGWTGSGITSAPVKADAAGGNAKQLAVGYFDSRDNAQTGLNVAAGQTLVQYTVYGDATGDSKVDIADLSVWNNNFGAGDRWSQGDFNYDGRIDISDLSVWNNDFGNQLAGGTIKPGARTAGAVAAASSAVAGHATPTLTSSAPASPAATPLPATLELDVNTATGDATLNSGGVTLAAIELDSASGILIKSGWQSLRLGHGFNQWSFPRGTPSATSLSEYTSDASSASGQPATLAAGTLTDYGLIFPVGFNDPTDLTFKYNIADPTTGLTAPRTGTVVFTSSGVPEPTCLALGSVAAMSLLGRRRRR